MALTEILDLPANADEQIDQVKFAIGSCPGRLFAGSQAK